MKQLDYEESFIEEAKIAAILDAIKIHSGGFDSDNIIALTLVLSDKLDIKHTKVAKEGYNIKGMKELQYIKDISIF